MQTAKLNAYNGESIIKVRDIQFWYINDELEGEGFAFQLEEGIELILPIENLMEEANKALDRHGR